MSKKQIKVSAEDVKGLIREALDMLGNQRYPEGVFSTDSEEGEKYKELAKSYERPDSDRRLKDGFELKDFGTSGEPWKDNPESIWDSDEKRDKIARDEFGDKEKEGKMYDESEGTVRHERRRRQLRHRLPAAGSGVSGHRLHHAAVRQR